MHSRVAAVGIALVAFAAGAGLWWLGRPAASVDAPSISGAALYASAFRDLQGRSQPLGQFQGRALVLNFWATWCAPCREEMPMLDQVARRWAARGVTFVGVSQETPDAVAGFMRQTRVGYPLWTGGAETAELARRLGNRIDALPFTALITPDGRVAATKLGPYREAELESELARIVPKRD